ncbi:hypothetical protein C8J95_102526 [Elizabethkingia sp. YR214]|nr:hypothetical protein C8J95_102526 [Elizabethkingia sp. YR214]
MVGCLTMVFNLSKIDCNFFQYWFYFAFESAIFIARKANTLAINHF